MYSPSARLALVLVVTLALAGCAGAESADESSGAPSSSAASSVGSRVTINGNEALTWGDGAYGVVLAHGAAFDAASWQAQATEIADGGTTVVAVEDIGAEAIGDAVRHLQDDGIVDVALIGGSAGASGILELARLKPELPDQLILLSPNSVVEGLGAEPKLFIASEDEAVASVSTELAVVSPGDQNEALLLPGSAHAQNIFDTDQGRAALDAILERVERFSTE